MGYPTSMDIKERCEWCEGVILPSARNRRFCSMGCGHDFHVVKSLMNKQDRMRLANEEKTAAIYAELLEVEEK